MRQWIKALRIPSGMGTALGVISGFMHSHQSVDWSVVFAVFFTTCTAMLWNDYHDREIDIAKGRPLASRHPTCFLRYTLVFATISLAFSIFVLVENSRYGMLCLTMWISCMLYYKAQTNPIAKNLIVSLNVGATVMFPLLMHSKTWILWMMAAILVTITSIREFVKDVEDMEVDRGKKLTLALVVNSQIDKGWAIRKKNQLFLALLLVILL